MSHAHRKTKFFLVGLLIAKITVTMLFLSGTYNIFEILFSQQVAIAQDKEPTDKEKVEADEEDDAEKEEEKKAAFKELRETLDGLEEKRIEIEEKRKVLNQERTQLESLRQEIEERIEQLSNVQKQLDTALSKMETKTSEEEKVQQAQDQAKIKQLVKVYTSMKPKTAAALINKLDMEVVLKLFSQMKGEQIGQILTYVDRERAALISEKLAPEKKRKRK